MTVLNFPALSPTMETGKISSWLKSEGDECEVGDVLCEIETDKATVSFEIQDEGVVAEILVKDLDEEISIGDPICVMLSDTSELESFKSSYPNGYPVKSVSGGEDSSLDKKAEEGGKRGAFKKDDEEIERIRASPAARHLGDQRLIDIY